MAETMRGLRPRGSLEADLQQYEPEARRLEAECEGGGLPLGCTVMVMGPKGMGKSAVINSLFGEDRASTSHTGVPHYELR